MSKNIVLALTFVLFTALNLFETPKVFSNQCSLALSKDSIDFGTAFPYEDQIQTLIIKNTSASELSIKDTYIFSRFAVFNVQSISSKELQPGDSTIITLSFKTAQNITYRGHLVVSVECPIKLYSISICLQGRAIYPNQEFAFTENLEGQALYNALNNYVNGATVYSYYDARNHMFTKADNVNGFVECIYTGKKIQTNSIPDPNIFNTEHSWPQSKGADKEPARSDVYHLYPADAKANEKRSNNPYGNVSRSVVWELGGSKLGLPQSASDTTFEPRDQSKGNVARSLFYFATRYGNRKGTYDTDGFLTKMETTLRDWNKKDPVDERERSRAESIATFQKRRNPFIEFPEIIDRFYKLSTQPDFPLYPEPATDLNGVYADVQGSDSVEIAIPIINKGNQQLKINSTEFKPATINAQVIYVDSIIPQATSKSIIIRMKKSIPTGTLLRVRFADGISTLPIPVASEKVTSGLEQITEEDLEISIAPNPAVHGLHQMVTFTAISLVQASIKLYDIHGNTIADITDLIQSNGYRHSINIPYEYRSTTNAVFCTIHLNNHTKTIVLFPAE